MNYPSVSFDLRVLYRGRHQYLAPPDEYTYPPDGWAFINRSQQPMPYNDNPVTWVPYFSFANSDPEHPWLLIGGFAANEVIRGGAVNRHRIFTIDDNGVYWYAYDGFGNPAYSLETPDNIRDIDQAFWTVMVTWNEGDTWDNLLVHWAPGLLMTGFFPVDPLMKMWIINSTDMARIPGIGVGAVGAFTGDFPEGRGIMLRGLSSGVVGWLDLPPGEPEPEGVSYTLIPEPAEPDYETSGGTYPEVLPPELSPIFHEDIPANEPTVFYGPAPIPLGSDLQAGGGSLSLRWRDDVGGWKNERVIDMGQEGDRFPVAWIHRLGAYRTRQWEIVWSDPTVQVVIGIEEEVEELSL